MRMIILMTLIFLFADTGISQMSDPSQYADLEYRTRVQIENKMAEVMEKYCRNSCQLLSTDIEIQEQLDTITDLGFEELDETQNSKIDYSVNSVSIKVQIDDKVTQTNRDKLEKIIKYNVQKFANIVYVQFFDLSVPDIGSSVSAKERAITKIKQKLTSLVEGVVQKYCPDMCLLSNVIVLGDLISNDQAQLDGLSNFVHDRSSGQYVKIDEARISLAFSQRFKEVERNRIESIINIKTKQIPNVTLVRSVMPFPETYTEKKAKEAAESADPYGLDKLRKTLNLFKELSTDEDIALTEEESTNRNLIFGGILGLIAIIIIGILIRYSNIQKESSLMKQAADFEKAQEDTEKDNEKNEDKEKEEALVKKKLDEEKDLLYRLKSEYLLEELSNIFFKAPKVAKETFGKMLHEDGVEQTSKYVHILGKTVVFELLNDPNYRRGLIELSEYYHKTEFEFTAEDEYKLLNSLKTKVTANEIRVASRKSIDEFEFLARLDVDQVYKLISNESARLQSVVLSQVPSKKRQSLFELFAGENKAELMSELCKADTIPKEYLTNLAKILRKKVSNSAEFDTENLRSNDVLLDLLEKSSLSEQKTLISELQITNDDAARAIKRKLVTVHILKYLKSGHLLEIILGLEQEELITFLSGAPQDVAKLLLYQAPEDLSESWMEELEEVRGVDETRYRMVEIKILNRVKSLAASGAVNIGEINDLIFSNVNFQQVVPTENDQLTA